MRDINLFEGIKKSGPQKKASRAASAGLLLLILCVLAVGGAYGWLRYTGSGLDAQIQSLNQSIIGKQSALTSNAGDLNSKKALLENIQTYNNTLAALDKIVQSYPKLNLDLLKDITGRMPSDVTVLSVSYDKGKLTLNCRADKVDSPANFVAELRESEFIDTVNYSKSSVYVAPDQKVADALKAGRYQFTVDSYLKGGVAE